MQMVNCGPLLFVIAMGLPSHVNIFVKNITATVVVIEVKVTLGHLLE